ncbi:MAG: hypothetical protein KAG56_09325 [Sulfurovaceae bacterium]|nr:hypothetical protein [Sulfurovaceae bacterium]
MAQRLLIVIQFILVFLFILFEEIIWEGLAQPIYKKIESLQITQKIETLLDGFNSKILLTIFVLLLLGVEGAGLLAGFFFVQGQMLLGLILYIAKIPIAAFTFWMFKVSKPKLLSFGWFNWAYEKLMSGIDWLKEREIYKTSREMVSKIKLKFLEIKQKYFTKDSLFTTEIKSFYKYIKNFKNRKKND